MFKVMCVKADSKDSRTMTPVEPLLEVGRIYTVDSVLKGQYYFLKEIASLDVFHHSLFARLSSDIDETELVNERVEVTA